jgi:hypothetical protein
LRKSNKKERAVNFTARTGFILRFRLLRGLDKIRNLGRPDAEDAFHHNWNIEQGYGASKHHGRDDDHGDSRTLFFLVEVAFLKLLTGFHNNTCPLGRRKNYTYKVIGCQGFIP